MSGVFLQGSNFILNSHWQRMRVQCLHILTNTLLSDFLILAIFVGVKWQVIMVLIYISLRTDDLSIFSSAFGLAGHILWVQKQFIGGRGASSANDTGAIGHAPQQKNFSLTPVIKFNSK